MKAFPVIDPVATGNNILQLRRKCGLTVRDLQEYFGFTEPQAIYKWQKGKTLPSVDNLFALSALLNVPMDRIIVAQSNVIKMEQQEEPCCSFYAIRNSLNFLLYESSARMRTMCRRRAKPAHRRAKRNKSLQD